MDFVYCEAVKSTSTGCGSYLETDGVRHLCFLSDQCDGDLHTCECGFRWSWPRDLDVTLDAAQTEKEKQ